MACNSDEGCVHYAHRIIWALYKMDPWKKLGTEVNH